MKRCSVCKQRHELAEFYRSQSSPDGRGYRCKRCDTAARRQYALKHAAKWAESRHAIRIKAIFGIDRDTYEAMLIAQNHACAICKTLVGDTAAYRNGVRRLSIDHDHDSGKVRGLLCSSCNRGIGLLKDSEDVLAAAIIYLKSHREKPS